MWTKLDDRFILHPKALALGDDQPVALTVWLAGLCYTASYRLDGFVPSGVVGAGTTLSAEQVTTGRDALLRVGLWETVTGGYLAHDYLDYNISRAQADARHAQKQSAGKAGADKRWSEPPRASEADQRRADLERQLVGARPEAAAQRRADLERQLSTPRVEA